MTNPLVERYHKAVKTCALFHLENWWVVQVAGKDAKDFLQRLGTADVRSLGKGHAARTLFLGGDGRIVADCYVVTRAADEFWLISNPACGQSLVDQLDRFIFTEDVALQRLDPAFYVGLVVGPSGDVLASQSPAGLSAEIITQEGCDRTSLVLSPEDFSAHRSDFYAAVEQAGGVFGDINLYHTLRIEAGIPEFGLDITNKTIPLEARLKSAISFTKGCFPGQEIVARINNLGHPANVLVGLKVPETTTDLAGKPLLMDSKEIGRITSICYSPGLNSPLALGYTKWAYRESGQVLIIGDGVNLPAEVVDLPLGKTE